MDNEYEATYPKRAKGLVKKGRARFVSENRICLACPPNLNLEDNNKMAEPENGKNAEKAAINNDVSKIAPPSPPGHAEAGLPKLTLDYLLSQIEKIAAQTDYLNQAISELRQMATTGPGDIGTAGKAEALHKVVTCRETTNQGLLRFYEKLYDDIKPEKPAFKDKALSAAQTAMDYGLFDEFSGFIDTLRNINE